MNQIPAKKRSIFSKQAFTKVNVAKDPVDFFSCAKKVYPRLLEEEERKRQSKIKRKVRENSKENEDFKNNVSDENKIITSPLKGFVDHTYNEGSSHSSFLSLHEESGKSGSPSNCDNKDSPRFHDVKSSQNLSVKKRKLLSHDETPSKSIIDLEKASPNPIISLESDDEEISQSTLDPFENDISYPPLSQSLPTERQPDKTDEEYPEFIQQAREREKLKAKQRLIAASYIGQQNKTSEENVNDIFDSEPKSAIEIDPTVELLITSELEGTRPLRVKRKLSQRLKEARLTWCEKQHIRTDKLGRPLEEAIFLTWRGKRLFDVTTCGSLGLKVDNGRTLSPGKNGLGPNGNIHLEAWTEDTLRAKEEKDSENRGNESENESKPDIDNDPICKLILKAKDMEPWKILVRPTTTVSKMIEAFRKAKAIPESTKISLHFDGDLLDPKSTIEDTELGDVENVDTVEVYLKG
ncbi:hypothetical protein EPUL_000797 [Erysiphe pulchra]|uniref:Rad60/SUMO-like domain-containing protein n=1 Tax=Erysiphe pulchra TaxID=225359 RepID=A0A2S4Q1T9_9PEZI|nr:hypothetical protein EPUL_000797 [Erysiphe pulchra]